MPLSSLRRIAHSLVIRAFTIPSHLAEAIVLTFFLLRWVPRIVVDELHQNGVELVGRSLRVFQGQRKVGFRDIMTGDESWFLQHYNHSQTSCLSADEILTRATQTIADEKTMLIMLSGPRHHSYQLGPTREKIQQQLLLSIDGRAVFSNPAQRADYRFSKAGSAR
jgi:hypothetical protein